MDALEYGRNEDIKSRSDVGTVVAKVFAKEKKKQPKNMHVSKKRGEEYQELLEYSVESDEVSA